MGMKLYYGGFGDYLTYTVAENEQKAIENIGKKINAPYLPITAEEISVVDGFEIRPYGKNEEIPVEISNSTEEIEIKVEIALRHCKKCDFTCETQGELLKHYRESHAKGDS